jgi:xanthine dehydrogenase YagT iron-sulfur-binding subunit
MSDSDEKISGLSRREFLKISGITVSVPMVVGPTVVKVAGEEVAIHPPAAMPITLLVNGKKLSASVEPRTTLLDALREYLDVTGAKRVCDRGTCGACTVLLDNKMVYACSLLAIEAQGKAITTAEGLMQGDKLHPVQQAFVDNDAQQCGFCTPGFVVATKAFLDKHPHATLAQMKHGLGGNFCRCGTYAGIRKVVEHFAGGGASAAAVRKGGA